MIDKANSLNEENFSNYQKLENWDSLRICDWLLDGFKDWEDSKRHYVAFWPINGSLSNYLDLIDQLISIFNDLSPLARIEWREGIRLGVRKCPKHQEWLPSLRWLLLLANKLEIHSVIYEIRQNWLNDFILNPQTIEARLTRAIIFNMLAGWAAVPESSAILWQFIETRYFERKPQITDLPLVFTLLLKLDPEKNLRLLLDKTRHSFLQLLEENPGFMLGFAASLTTQINLSDLIRNLHKIKISKSDIDDKWLLLALFGNQLSISSECINKLNISSLSAYPLIIHWEGSLYEEQPIIHNKYTEEKISIQGIDSDGIFFNLFESNLELYNIFQNSGILPRVFNKPIEGESMISDEQRCRNILKKLISH